jgi:hypothetical protein
LCHSFAAHSRLLLHQSPTSHRYLLRLRFPTFPPFRLCPPSRLHQSFLLRQSRRQHHQPQYAPLHHPSLPRRSLCQLRLHSRVRRLPFRRPPAWHFLPCHRLQGHFRRRNCCPFRQCPGIRRPHHSTVLPSCRCSPQELGRPERQSTNPKYHRHERGLPSVGVS